MFCPVCNHRLKNIQHEDQSLDICSKCGGLWFDRGELRKSLDSLLSKNKVDYQTIKESYRKKIAVLKQHASRKCPRCDRAMSTFNYFGDSNIFLDKCDSCKGIWADKGEMRSVARYLKGNPDMVTYGKALAYAKKNYPRSTSDTAKLIAVAIACVYLILTALIGVEAFIDMLLYLIMPLACIFFGEELGYLTEVRFRLTFLTPVVTKKSPGSIVALMGWILLLLPPLRVMILIMLMR